MYRNGSTTTAMVHKATWNSKIQQRVSASIRALPCDPMPIHALRQWPIIAICIVAVVRPLHVAEALFDEQVQ